MNPTSPGHAPHVPSSGLGYTGRAQRAGTWYGARPPVRARGRGRAGSAPVEPARVASAAGPAQRDVHVVPVPQRHRAARDRGAGRIAVALAVEGVVGGPHVVVPDDIHDPHPPRERVSVALAVGREDPVEEAPYLVALVRVGRVHRPVDGPAVLVLRGPARAARADRGP